jgi:hypothetical protein
MGFAIFFNPCKTCSRDGIGMTAPFGVVCVGSPGLGARMAGIEYRCRHGV